VNRSVIEFLYNGKGGAVFARFPDPERRLRYPEPAGR
jgi:hypothetical protein